MPPSNLAKFLSIEPENNWLMSPVERLVIIGLLEIVRPARTLELGHRFGGCTEWMCRYSGEVHSVDVDPWVIESCKRWPNAHPVHADTQTAMRDFEQRGVHFDFALVDADHSYESARDDLMTAARIADIIVLHDSFNPVCRSGYVAALEQMNAYSDLDLADGHIQSDGIWGGLGIVVTSIPKGTQRQFTPRLHTHEILVHQQSVRTSRRYRAKHVLQLAINLKPRTLDLFQFDGHSG